MKKYIILISIISIIIGALFSTSGHYYGVMSPDGQFSIYTSKYNFEYLLGTEHSYASGKVFLYDEIEDNVIESKKVSRISATHEAQWSKQSVSLRCEGLPSFKLPRKIKLPYKVDYKNGLYKVFEPDGSLSREGYNLIVVDGHCYQRGTEKKYFNDKLSYIKVHEYFPDSLPTKTNKDSLIHILKEDWYKNGVLTSHKEYQHRLKDNRWCNCGNWISYDKNKKPSKVIKYQDCYIPSTECERKNSF